MHINWYPPKWNIKIAIGYIVSLVLGVFLHFCFQLWPTILTEFISPVNESIWEHTKIIFWPLLLLLPPVYGRKQQGACFLGVLASSFAMLFLGWLYHVVLGGHLMAVDLLIFVFVVALGWTIPTMLELPENISAVLNVLIVFFVALLLAFTIMPPDGPIFQDARLVDAWVRMTC